MGWKHKIFNGFILWSPWQPEFFKEHNNYERGPPKENSCEISEKFQSIVSEEKFFEGRLYGLTHAQMDRQTHARRTQRHDNSSLAFGQWSLKLEGCPGTTHWARMTLTFDLPEWNLQNGTSTYDGEQLCQIILKSIHNCRSYSLDNFGWTHACKQAHANTHMYTEL